MYVEWSNRIGVSVKRLELHDRPKLDMRSFDALVGFLGNQFGNNTTMPGRTLSVWKNGRIPIPLSASVQ